MELAVSVFDALGGAKAALADGQEAAVALYQELVMAFVRCADGVDLEGARAMLQRMEKDGCPPDAVTYGRIIHHLHKHAQTAVVRADGWSDSPQTSRFREVSRVRRGRGNVPSTPVQGEVDAISAYLGEARTTSPQ